MENNCIRCNKKLVPIADKRKNGTTRHNDWNSRKYHKKCYLEIIERERLEEYFKERGVNINF